MPMRRFCRKTNFRRKPKARMVRRGRKLRANPQPIFTETYKLPATWAPNSGNILTFNVKDVPQLAQYSNLYQKYRILKASVTLLPQYTNQDENVASYNAGNNVWAVGMGRFVYAINDTPGSPAPTSEADVLKDNGCKILAVRTKIGMRCKPVPGTLDANGVTMTLKRKYINFRTVSTDNADHFGIAWWYTQPNLGTTALVNNDLHVYIKLTFQLADPR